MRGQPFSYDGRHYSARPADFMTPDPPVGQPHYDVIIEADSTGEFVEVKPRVQAGPPRTSERT